MKNLIITGAGKIGSLITFLLSREADYHITVVDRDFSGPDFSQIAPKAVTQETLDVRDEAAFSRFIEAGEYEAVVSSLPYYCNHDVAKIAARHNLHYFDLTEDVSVTRQIQQLSNGAKTAFVPQCGLAPGFISIVANDLMKTFDKLDTVKLRVGALPENTSHGLHYAITWSLDGIINEYGNPCHAVDKGEIVTMQPLEGLETLQFDGCPYEAFNTSGGIGSLAESYVNRVNVLNYKTLRYPGHCEKMRFLMTDLKLNHDRGTLKHILAQSVPRVEQDVVVIYVSVTGEKQGELVESHYFQKVFPQTIDEHHWSAIQITTAAGVCAVIDEVLAHPDDHHGFVLQEEFTLDAILNNRFGAYYQQG